MESKSDLFLRTLIQSLQLLAAPSEQQIQLLPTFVHVPDEVALIFNDAYMLVEQLAKNDLITEEQQSNLRQLEESLDQMSEDKELWNIQSLKISTRWEEIRLLAEKILISFHEKKQPPNLFWFKYIEGKPDKMIQ